jgi:stage V sporulation protein SpoVS
VNGKKSQNRGQAYTGQNSKQNRGQAYTGQNSRQNRSGEILVGKSSPVDGVAGAMAGLVRDGKTSFIARTIGPQATYKLVCAVVQAENFLNDPSRPDNPRPGETRLVLHVRQDQAVAPGRNRGIVFEISVAT